jgi:hypothetical protein
MPLPAFVAPVGTAPAPPPPPVAGEAGDGVPAPVGGDPNGRTRWNNIDLHGGGHNFEDLRRSNALGDQLSDDERARDEQRRDQATYGG